MARAQMGELVELELYVARLERCLRSQIAYWRAHGGPEGRAALEDIFDALGDMDTEGVRILSISVLARTVDDILTLMGGGSKERDNRGARRPFYARWDADSEDAFRSICEQDERVQFWCDVAGIDPDVLAAECAERMAQCPIGWLL